MQNKNIYITGFMGSGKTTVGKLLAQKLSRKFTDMDSLIEKMAQMSIAEIFEIHGEAHFRELELQALAVLGQSNNLVVSLGGGAVMDPKNQIVLNKGLWIFLNTPFDILKERILRKDHRPLGKDPKKLEELYKKRLPVYQSAPIIIDNTGEPESICQQILQRILK